MTISEYIVACEKGGSEAKVSKLLDDLKAKKITADEIHAHYDAQYRPILMAKLMAFQQGNLFACQKEDFQTWMMAKSYAQDFQRYLEFRGILDMVSKDFRKAGAAVMVFAMARILRPGNGAVRSEAEKAHGREAVRQKWLRTNTQHHWDWRHA